ncbi:putative LysM domain-containing protein [Seiridium cardinale]|uniref:LysM domain-containing protein n=1 Tax=Seiridium cardinale TaxID=138064 RepID=A0ABR2XH97_9PEZI
MATSSLWHNAALVALVILPAHAASEFLLHPISSSQLSGASEECLRALNGGVDCSVDICSLYQHPGRFFEQPTLYHEICTTGCYESLLSLKDDIASKCSADAKYYPGSNRQSQPKPVTYRTDQAIYNYNLMGLSSDGQYCNAIAQAQTVTVPPDGMPVICDECQFRKLELEAASHLTEDKEWKVSILSLWREHCKYDGHPAILVDTNHIVPLETPSFSYLYPIQPNDTFLRVSITNRMATHELVRANGLDGSRKLPGNGKLFIRNQCNIYIVKEDDDCGKIANQHNITTAQLLRYNRHSLRGFCSFLRHSVGEAICVSPPLRMHAVIPVPGKALPSFPEPSEDPPLAPGTRDDCWEYACREDENSNKELMTIDGISFTHNLGKEDIIKWNPDLSKAMKADGNEDSASGAFALSMSYCVGLKPTQGA